MASQALEAPLGSQDVNSWSIDRVCGWLEFTGLSHLAEAFQAHRITGDVLLDLSLDDCAEIGVHASGDKKRLLRAVAHVGQVRAPRGCPALGFPPTVALPCGPRQDIYPSNPSNLSNLQQPCQYPSVSMQQRSPHPQGCLMGPSL